MEWLQLAFHSEAARAEHLQRHDLGTLPIAIAGFTDFFDTRRAEMKTRLQKLLGNETSNVKGSAEIVG
jgi:hypothetical protein